MNVTPTTICLDLLALIKRFKASLAELAESHGLTTIQLATLHAINDGQTTMGHIAQTMHCDASNVTGIIDRLVTLQLVTRQENPYDRRVKAVGLTIRGRDILQEIMAVMPERLGCTRLSESEQSSLHDILAKL